MVDDIYILILEGMMYAVCLMFALAARKKYVLEIETRLNESNAKWPLS